jgi:hypothetical protein
VTSLSEFSFELGVLGEEADVVRFEVILSLLG